MRKQKYISCFLISIFLTAMISPVVQGIGGETPSQNSAEMNRLMSNEERLITALEEKCTEREKTEGTKVWREWFPEIDGITYAILDDHATVVYARGGLLPSTSVSILSHVEGKPVTMIQGMGDSGEFHDVTDVSIPNTVEYIFPDAFFGFTSLRSITIPDSVREIGYGAFYSTGIESIVLPKNIFINGAFEYMPNLEEITFPEGTRFHQRTDVADRIFTDCPRLKRIVFESAVKLPYGLAENCPNLEEIVFKTPFPSTQVFRDLAANETAPFLVTGTTSKQVRAVVPENGLENYKAEVEKLPTAHIPYDYTGAEGATYYEDPENLYYFGLLLCAADPEQDPAQDPAPGLEPNDIKINREGDGFIENSQPGKEKCLQIHMNSSKTLTAKVEPSGANQTVIWETGNPDIATIDADGTLKPVSTGTATITAYTYNKMLFDEIEIEVGNQLDVKVDVSTDLILWGSFRKDRENEINEEKQDMIDNYKPGLGDLIDFFVPRFARMQAFASTILSPAANAKMTFALIEARTNPGRFFGDVYPKSIDVSVTVTNNGDEDVYLYNYEIEGFLIRTGSYKNDGRPDVNAGNTGIQSDADLITGFLMEPLKSGESATIDSVTIYTPTHDYLISSRITRLSAAVRYQDKADSGGLFEVQGHSGDITIREFVPGVDDKEENSWRPTRNIAVGCPIDLRVLDSKGNVIRIIRYGDEGFYRCGELLAYAVEEVKLLSIPMENTKDYRLQIAAVADGVMSIIVTDDKTEGNAENLENFTVYNEVSIRAGQVFELAADGKPELFAVENGVRASKISAAFRDAKQTMIYFYIGGGIVALCLIAVFVVLINKRKGKRGMQP